MRSEGEWEKTKAEVMVRQRQKITEAITLLAKNS